MPPLTPPHICPVPPLMPPPPTHTHQSSPPADAPPPPHTPLSSPPSDAPLPPNPTHPPKHLSSYPADAPPISPHTHHTHLQLVCSRGRGHVGDIYWEPATGYGTRMLRFGKRGWGQGPGLSRQQHSGGSSSSGSEGSVSVARGPAPFPRPLHELPAVCVGLNWRWPGGRADGLLSAVELLHELGHACHLLMAQRGAR